MKNIICAIESAVPVDGADDSLRIEGFGNRIRIDVRNVEAGANDLAFDLLIGYQLAYCYGEKIRNVLNAMVLALDRPDAGAAGVMRLGDPDVRPVSPNYFGEPPDDEKATAFFGGRYGLRIAASVARRERDPIYLRVCLRHLVSNGLTLEPFGKLTIDDEEKR